MIVLESPLSVKEIKNWDMLIATSVASPREFMPRGRKTDITLRNMKRKMADTSRYIEKVQAEIDRLKKSIKKRKGDKSGIFLIEQKINDRKREIIKKIVGLNLNEEKFNKLKSKIKIYAEKISQHKNIISGVHKRSGCSIEDLRKTL